MAHCFGDEILHALVCSRLLRLCVSNTGSRGLGKLTVGPV